MRGMILCAGLGTRFKPHSETLAKPALPFLTLPMLCYPVMELYRIGIKQFIINTHHLPKSIENAAEAHLPQDISIDYSFEEKQIMGTGGALSAAVSFWNEDSSLLITSGDALIAYGRSNPYEALIKNFQTHRPLASLLCCEHPKAGQGLSAVWADENHNVKGFGPKNPTDLPNLKPYHFIGPRMVSRDILAYTPEGPSHIFYDVMTKAIADNQAIKLCLAEDVQGFETGDLQSYLDSTSEVLKKIYDARPEIRNLSQTLNALAPKVKLSQRFETLLLKHESASVHPKCELKDFLVCAAGCEVDEGANLQRVVLHENVQIPQGAVHSNSLIFADSDN